MEAIHSRGIGGGNDGRPSGSDGHSAAPVPFHLGASAAHTAAFRFTAHPYAFSHLLRLLPIPTVASVARCTKQMYYAAIPILYPPTLRLECSYLQTPGPVVTTLPTTTFPSDFSLSLYFVYQRVRTLHILQYDSPSVLLAERYAHFTNLATLVVHPPAYTPVLKMRNGITPAHLPNPAELVVRLSDLDPESVHRDVSLFAKERTVFQVAPRAVTLLIPLTPDIWAPRSGSPSRGPWKDCKFPSSGRAITIVFLPTEIPQASIHAQWVYHFETQFRTICELLVTLTSCPVLFVGVEYGGMLPNGKERLMQNSEKELPARVTFTRFVDWLDSQEPGKLFDDEEEAVLRLDDWHLLGQNELRLVR